MMFTDGPMISSMVDVFLNVFIIKNVILVVSP